MTDAKKQPSVWAQVIAKLTHKTQQGEMSWEVDRSWSPPDQVDRRDLTAYRTTFQEWIIRLRKYELLARPNKLGMFSTAEGEFMSTVGLSVFGEAKAYWTSTYVLELITDSGDTLYGVPDKEGLSGLYSAVQYRASGAGDFVKALLSDK